MLSLRALLLSICTLPLFADLTPDQRVLDFQALAGLYGRYYAPASWKMLAFGINIFDLKPWLTRVRAAKSDVEYLQICAEYVGSLRDGHSNFQTTSTFTAEIGLFTDIYDGKVLIESVDRDAFPARAYPFQMGDEVVSIDGVPVMDVIRELAKVVPMGTPRATLRNAGDFLFFRPQALFPLAVQLGDSATVVIRDANGAESPYNLPWVKTGTPLLSLPGIPATTTDSFSTKTENGVRSPKLLEGVESIDPDAHGRLSRKIRNENGDVITRGDILGMGIAVPYYPLPSNFVRRRNGITDFFYSGTYTADNQRIGYIRIPNFAPANAANSIREFENEILFFRDNTDGLVVDVSRNTGGGCVGVEWASRLIPTRFQAVQRQYRPWFDLVSAYGDTVQQLKELPAVPQWVIDTYQFLYDLLSATAKVPGAMTGFIGRCNVVNVGPFSAPSADQLPARNQNGDIIAYSKPVIFLGDDFSASFADSFLADMQDNQRGLIVGTRTSGLGGTRSPLFNAGPLSETYVSVTIGINGRNKSVAVPGLPTSPYIENAGVLPDIELDYMTRENLLANGRIWVDGFTRIIVDQIVKSKGQ